MEPAFLSVEQAAERIGGHISCKFVLRLIERGELQKTYLGSRRLIVRESLEQWIEDRKADSAPVDRELSFVERIRAIGTQDVPRKKKARRGATRQAV